MVPIVTPSDEMDGPLPGIGKVLLAPAVSGVPVVGAASTDRSTGRTAADFGAELPFAFHLRLLHRVHAFGASGDPVYQIAPHSARSHCHASTVIALMATDSSNCYRWLQPKVAANASAPPSKPTELPQSDGHCSNETMWPHPRKIRCWGFARRWSWSVRRAPSECQR